MSIDHSLFYTTDFNHKILEYDSIKGRLSSKSKDEKSSYPWINFILKLFRYIFNPDSRLHHVVGGMVKTAALMKNETPQEISQYIKFVNLFVETVVKNHNDLKGGFRSPVSTANLNQALDELAKHRTALLEKEAQLKDKKAQENAQLALTVPENCRSSLEYFFRNGLVFDINEVNLLPLAKFAKDHGNEKLRELCDKNCLYNFDKLQSPDPTKPFDQMKTIDKIEAFLNYTQEYGLVKIREEFFTNYSGPYIEDKNYDEYLEIATKFKLKNLRKQCDRCFKDKWVSNNRKSGFPGPHYEGIDFIDIQWRAVHSSPDKEEIDFQNALQMDFPQTAEAIYNEVLSYVVFDFQPCPEPHMAQLLKESAIFRDKRITFLKTHLPLMQKMPEIEKYHLLNEKYHLLEVAFQFPDKLRILFEFLLTPYLYFRGKIIPKNTLSWPRAIEKFKGTSKEFVEIYEILNQYAKKTNNPELIDYFQNWVISPSEIFKKVKEEIAKLGDDEAKKGEIYRFVRSHFYPLITPVMAASWGENDYGSEWKGFQVASQDFRFNSKAGVDFLEFEEAAKPYLTNISIKDEATKNVVCILPDGQKLSLHQEVLASQSKFFQDMLKGQSAEAIPSEISLEKTFKPEEQSAFMALIDYMYTNKLDVTKENAPYIIKLAQKLGIEPMLPIFVHWIEFINSGNLKELGLILETAEAEGLINFCRRKVDSLYRNSPKEVELLKKYGKYKKSYGGSIPDLELFATLFPNVQVIFWNDYGKLVFDMKAGKALSQLKNLYELTLNSRIGVEVDIAAVCLLKDCKKLTRLEVPKCDLKTKEDRSDVGTFQGMLKSSFSEFRNVGFEVDLGFDLYGKKSDKVTAKIYLKKF